jgi:hypothetical protein
VVLAVDDYERLRAAAKAARPSFVEHLLAIPPDSGEDSDLRAEARPRPVEF